MGEGRCSKSSPGVRALAAQVTPIFGGRGGHRPVLRTHRPDLFSYRPGLRTHRPVLRTHRPDLFSYRPGLRTYRPVLPTHRPDLFSNHRYLSTIIFLNIGFPNAPDLKPQSPLCMFINPAEKVKERKQKSRDSPPRPLLSSSVPTIKTKTRVFPSF